MDFTEEAVVVDANVIIHSRAQYPFRKAVIPPSVRAEIKSEIAKMKGLKLNLEVMQPSDESRKRVRKKAEEINSPTSEEDGDALALAIDRGLTLVTDDRALQNLALHMGVDFQGFNTEKVETKRRWRQVCSNCGTDVSTPPCPRCGSREMDRKRDQRS
ncbi:MAG: NOB1 family endonuclease [Candidatus Nanohalobium sp.]